MDMRAYTRIQLKQDPYLQQLCSSDAGRISFCANSEFTQSTEFTQSNEFTQSAEFTNLLYEPKLTNHQIY
jgi:hypothetical protein